MSLDIYKLHKNTSKLKGYMTDEYFIFRDLQSYLKSFEYQRDQYPDRVRQIFEHLFKSHEKNEHKLLEVIASNPIMSYAYALTTLQAPFPQGEKCLAKTPIDAFRYALNVVKGRFELGEPAIATDANYSFKYARDIIEGRFELGEPTILKDEDYTSRYVSYILEPNGLKVKGFNT